MAAVIAKAFGSGWSTFWADVTTPATKSVLEFTVVSSVIVTVINAVMGTLIAWVLVRDNFPGKRVLDFVIDIPFALPTIVAGLVLLAVYGTDSPVGVDLLGTRRAIVIALLFVTLPFVVRSVQPVLQCARSRVGTGGQVPRRRAVDHVPAHRPALADAGHRLGCGARVRPRHG